MMQTLLGGMFASSKIHAITRIIVTNYSNVCKIGIV